MKVLPCWGKIEIKPDNNYEKTTDGYKVKGSNLVIPEHVATKKERAHLTGTIVAVGPSAGIDDNGNRHHTFSVGQRVVYVGANVLDVKVGGETKHFLQDDFIVAILEE